MTVPFTKIITE